LLASGLGYGVYLLSLMAPIGTAYAAKTLCSGVFVANRPADDVIREDIRADNHPLLQAIEPHIDRAHQSAYATLFGMAKREAVYLPDRGCSLYFDGAVAKAEASTTPSDVAPDERFVADSDPAVDRRRVQAAIDSAFSEPDPAHLRRTRAIVVLHKGALLGERYAEGFGPQTPMLGWSMTKSVAGALIGILVREGKLSLLNSALLPEWRGPGDRRAQITLDQLLRMTSGLHFTEDHADPLADVAIMLFAASDAAGYAIEQPLEVQPGTRWRYSSGTSNILAVIMRRALSGTQADYLQFPRRSLFEPIGMQRAVLETDAAGNFIMSSYLYASPYDWARFGQFLLQDGSWQGRRILPAGWVRYMRTLTPQSTYRHFGAHLWVQVPPPFDSLRKPAPQLPPDTFHSVGHEGQFVSVIPSRQLVVVRLGLTRGPHLWDHAAFLEMLLAAVPP
jgi:CubicO group peptidase (beta-lactamase class C family)